MSRANSAAGRAGGATSNARDTRSPSTFGSRSTAITMCAYPPHVACTRLVLVAALAQALTRTPARPARPPPLK
jgi:hypothetical protein